MRAIISIALREFKSYFYSPMAYVALGIFLLLSGYYYASILVYFHNASVQSMAFQQPSMSIIEGIVAPFYHFMSVVLLFVIPFITMRLFAEEKKQKTLELLYTAPLSTAHIVLGKFLASVAFLAVMLLAMAYAPVILFVYGSPEMGPILTSNLGIFLLGTSFIAIGALCSSLTENQMVAAILTFGLLLLFFLLKFAAMTVAKDAPILQEMLSYLSILEHHDNMVEGLIFTRDLVYYVSLTSIALFFSWLKLEAHRWA